MPVPALRALKKPAAKPLVHKKKHEKLAAKPSVHQKRENQVAGQRETHQKREKTYQDKQTQTEKEPKTSGSEVMGQRQKVAVLPALLAPLPPPGGGPPPLPGAIFLAAYAGASDTSGRSSEQDGPDCCDDGPGCCYSIDTETEDGGDGADMCRRRLSYRDDLIQSYSTKKQVLDSFY